MEVHLRKHRSGGIRTLTLTAEVGDEAQFLDALERVGNLGGRVLVHTHDGGFVGIQFGDSPVYHVSVLDPSVPTEGVPPGQANNFRHIGQFDRPIQVAQRYRDAGDAVYHCKHALTQAVTVIRVEGGKVYQEEGGVRALLTFDESPAPPAAPEQPS